MTRDEKTVLLAAIIPIIYAVIMFLEKGMFIFPFPLNEVIFAAVSIIFAIRLRNYYMLQVSFSVAYALFNLLSVEFVWTLFLDGEQMHNLIESGSLDLIKLISVILLVIWGGISLVRAEDRVRSLFFVVFFAFLASATVFHQPLLGIIACLVPFGAAFRYKDLFPFHLLWLLLAILSTMKTIMLSMAN